MHGRLDGSESEVPNLSLDKFLLLWLAAVKNCTILIEGRCGKVMAIIIPFYAFAFLRPFHMDWGLDWGDIVPQQCQAALGNQSAHNTPVAS
jgi:hypothetical protein